MGRIEENKDTWDKILKYVKEHNTEETTIFEPMVINQLNIMNALLHDISKSLAVIADTQMILVDDKLERVIHRRSDKEGTDVS